MSSSSSLQRRLHPRSDIEGIRGRFHFTTDVRVLDLSATGVGLETGSYLSVGRGYTLTMARVSRPVRVEGRVVWCSLVRTEAVGNGESRSVYRAGIQFDEMLTAAASSRLDFIGTSGIVEPSERVFGRFSLEPQSRALIQYIGEFEAKSAAKRGMTIEAAPVSDIEEMIGNLVDLRIDLEQAAFRAESRIIDAQLVESGDEGPLMQLAVEFVRIRPEDLEVFEKRLQAPLAQALAGRPPS